MSQGTNGKNVFVKVRLTMQNAYRKSDYYKKDYDKKDYDGKILDSYCEDDFGDYIDEEGELFEEEPQEYKNYDEATKNYLKEKKRTKKKRINIAVVGLVLLLVVFVLNMKVEQSMKDNYIVGSNSRNSSKYVGEQTWWDVKMHITGTHGSGKLYITFLDGNFLDKAYTDEDIIEKYIIDEPGDIDIELELGDYFAYDVFTGVFEGSDDCEFSSCSVEITYNRKVVDILIERIMTEITSFG